MSQQWVRLFGLMVSLALLVMACGSREQAAADKYTEIVLATLRGDPLADAGLGQIIAETAGDLDCSDEVCISPLRFQYLRDQASERQPTVADYQGQLCHNRKVRIPAQLKEQHHTLCTELSALYKALDSVKMNASDALRLLEPSGQEGAAPGSLLQEFVNRLARERQNILSIQEKLWAIDWLQPIFVG